MRETTVGILCWAICCVVGAVQQPSVSELLKKAQSARTDGQLKEAVAWATKAVKAAPKNTEALLLRADLYERLDQWRDALHDWNTLIASNPKTADLYQRRGILHFKAGNIKQSIADFDKFIAMRPDQKVRHWQRGISYYYAGKFLEGQRQFEGYQTFDSNDVENAVWRFLCQAKLVGVKKAREDILKIGDDRRVPMRQIYEMFAGNLKPADILKAVEKRKLGKVQRNGALFYAHLYLGLYYEIIGNAKRAKQHITTAADAHRIGHYMWDVARVHRDLLMKKGK